MLNNHHALGQAETTQMFEDEQVAIEPTDSVQEFINMLSDDILFAKSVW